MLPLVSMQIILFALWRIKMKVQSFRKQKAFDKFKFTSLIRYSEVSISNCSLCIRTFDVTCDVRNIKTKVCQIADHPVYHWTLLIKQFDVTSDVWTSCTAIFSISKYAFKTKVCRIADHRYLCKYINNVWNGNLLWQICNFL